jgi:phosphomannomutase
MPYLALRSKKLSKSQLTEEVTLKDIITEEFSKYNFGEQILLEGDRQQLNEFQIFNKLAAGLKNVSTKVKNQVKNILSTIMARVKEAIDYIKTLGGKIFNAILNFLGMEVTDVDIKTSGPFPLI